MYKGHKQPIKVPWGTANWIRWNRWDTGFTGGRLESRSSSAHNRDITISALPEREDVYFSIGGRPLCFEVGATYQQVTPTSQKLTSCKQLFYIVAILEVKVHFTMAVGGQWCLSYQKTKLKIIATRWRLVDWNPMGHWHSVRFQMKAKPLQHTTGTQHSNNSTSVTR